MVCRYTLHGILLDAPMLKSTLRQHSLLKDLGVMVSGFVILDYRSYSTTIRVCVSLVGRA